MLRIPQRHNNTQYLERYRYRYGVALGQSNVISGELKEGRRLPCARSRWAKRLVSLRYVVLL